MIEIGALPKQATSAMVLNITNPRMFHWTRDLLFVLRELGLTFDVVSPTTWFEKLVKYSETTDPEKAMNGNPAVKLIDYFEKLVQNQPRNSQSGQVGFDIHEALACSSSLRNAPDVLADGVVKKCVRRWLKNWYNHTGASGS